METQKIVNSLNNTDNESSKFATKNGMSLMVKITQSMVKEMKMIQALNLRQMLSSQVCDYSDAYIFATGDITAIGGDANTDVPFKNCAPFTRCVTHINDEHIDTAENLDITKPMYNLIEYSDNYSDTSGSLWQFKRDESPTNDRGNSVNVAIANSSPFKYKSRTLKNQKLLVIMEYQKMQK